MKFSSLGNLSVFCHSSLRKGTGEEASKTARDPMGHSQDVVHLWTCGVQGACEASKRRLLLSRRIHGFEAQEKIWLEVVI